MDSRDTIKKWLADFDSIIDRHAANPAAVKRDNLQRRLFELAFPPQGLPAELKFAADGEAPEFDEIVQAHHPYYLSKKTTTTKTSTTTHETRTTTKLVLKLKNLEGVGAVLGKHGLLCNETKMLGKGSKGQKSGPYRQLTSALLKLRQSLETQLAGLENLEREAKERGDAQTIKQCQDDRVRIRQDIERLGNDL